MDNRVESIEKREPFIIFAGKFSLGNRMCVLLFDSRTLEKDGEKMDARNVGEGEMSGFYRITHRMLPRNHLDRSLRTHLMIAIAQYARVSPSVLRVESLLTAMAAIDST